MLCPIQQMKYFLPTAFGDLEAFFGSLDNDLAFQGSCQGNKGSPAFLLAASTFLMYMLHWLGHVARIVLAILCSVLEVVRFLFIDDTDLMEVAKTKSETPRQVTSCMQDAINAWHEGLRASGGALKPDKRSWCLVSFFWERGQWLYASTALQPGTLTIPVPNGNPVLIT
jgi:hypothetical protein